MVTTESRFNYRALRNTKPLKKLTKYSLQFKNSKVPKMMKVHATFNETRRILSLQKGGKVRELRYRFLQVFSDVLLDHVAPADVKLERYDRSFQDYVELNSDEKLEDDIKIRALVSKQDKQFLLGPLLNSDEKLEDDTKIRALVSKQDKQTATPSAGEVETSSKHLHCGPHWVFPWIHIHAASAISFPATHLFPAQQTDPFKLHPVTADTNYRLWSLVSRQNDGLLQRDTSNNNVNGKGSFSSSSNTVITTSAISQDYVSLIFKDGSKQYVVTAEDKGSNIQINAIEYSSGYPYPDNATFVADYFWSYTMFKNKQHNTKYLGCDSSGNTTLVDMKSVQYPNPQALFILNTV